MPDCLPYIPAELPPRVGVLATRATNLSIPNSGAFTDITLTAESQDTSGFFAPTSATITIPAGLGGVYGVTGQIVWATSDLTLSTLRFVVTGSHYDFNGEAAGGTHAGAFVIVLAPGDTIKMQASQQDVAGAINVTSARLSAYLLTQ